MSLHLILSGLLLVITGLPYFRSPVWWVRACEFPRAQIACLLLLMLCLLPWVPDYPPGLQILVAIVLALCLIVQLWWIFPYAPFSSYEVRPASHEDAANRLRLLSVNVLMPNENKRALLELIRDRKPDIFVTLESDLAWERALDVLHEAYPHGCKCPLDNLYGMHVYSRLPVHDVHLEFLVESDKPSVHLQLELESGRRIQLHCLHPAPPSPTENETSSERDAELIIVAQQLADTHAPVIVAGDLNDVAWSRSTRLFRRISGMLDPRLGRGLFNTFHAGYRAVRYPLDHFFLSSHFSLVSITRLPSIGSDHFPMMIEVQYEASQAERAGNETHLEADAEDHELANEMAARESVSASDVPTPGHS